MTDGWMDGFEFKIRITKKDSERDSKRGISDFLNVHFCVCLLELQQSINPAIRLWRINPIIHWTAVKYLKRKRRILHEV
ncbi:MAG TPA: hypothetical protein DET40_20105 [Lentisphaeria bacterium]|nr:MAG: hypothetical protein A2X45_24095 [Lentisphaerae bacterium GWF2_50_93]HCE45855.1 hypothetical protein [Lentisphaeria bacterium]